MGLNSEFVYVYTVRCDGCRKEAKPAFHSIVAICSAKRKGFQRFEIGEKKDVAWFCGSCLKNPDLLERLTTKPPVPLRAATASR